MITGLSRKYIWWPPEAAEEEKDKTCLFDGKNTTSLEADAAIVRGVSQ
jgi:hypothetical protein